VESSSENKPSEMQTSTAELEKNSDEPDGKATPQNTPLSSRADPDELAANLEQDIDSALSSSIIPDAPQTANTDSAQSAGVSSSTEPVSQEEVSQPDANTQTPPTTTKAAPTELDAVPAPTSTPPTTNPSVPSHDQSGVSSMAPIAEISTNEAAGATSPPDAPTVTEHLAEDVSQDTSGSFVSIQNHEADSVVGDASTQQESAEQDIGEPWVDISSDPPDTADKTNSKNTPDSIAAPETPGGGTSSEARDQSGSTGKSSPEEDKQHKGKVNKQEVRKEQDNESRPISPVAMRRLTQTGAFTREMSQASDSQTEDGAETGAEGNDEESSVEPGQRGNEDDKKKTKRQRKAERKKAVLEFNLAESIKRQAGESSNMTPQRIGKAAQKNQTASSTAQTPAEEEKSKRNQENDAKKRREEEVAAKKTKEDAAKKRQEEEATKKRKEEEAAKKRQEEVAAKKAQEAAAKKRQEEEAIKKRKEEETTKKRQEEEQVAKQKREEEAKEREKELTLKKQNLDIQRKIEAEADNEARLRATQAPGRSMRGGKASVESRTSGTPNAWDTRRNSASQSPTGARRQDVGVRLQHLPMEGARPRNNGPGTPDLERGPNFPHASASLIPRSDSPASTHSRESGSSAWGGLSGAFMSTVKRFTDTH
jgi:hypothetical protein